MKQVVVTILLICSLAAAADTLKGVVQNSTTNKPSAGDEVTLKKIGKGMEDVAKTKTNAKGEFSFNVPPHSSLTSSGCSTRESLTRRPVCREAYRLQSGFLMRPEHKRNHDS